MQQLHVFGVAHRDKTQFVCAVVCLDHHKWLFLDAIFFVLALDPRQHHIDLALQALQPSGLTEAEVFAAVVQRMNQPGIYTQQFAQALGHFFIAAKVGALAPCGPTGVQRWQQVLLMNVFQNAGHTGTQVVIEQNGARVKVFQTQATLRRNGF